MRTRTRLRTGCRSRGGDSNFRWRQGVLAALLAAFAQVGFARVTPPDQTDAVSFRVRANAAWRQAGLALYSRPSTRPNDA